MPAAQQRTLTPYSGNGILARLPRSCVDIQVADCLELDDLARFALVCQGARDTVHAFAERRPFLKSLDPKQPLSDPLTDVPALAPHLTSPLIANRDNNFDYFKLKDWIISRHPNLRTTHEAEVSLMKLMSELHDRKKLLFFDSQDRRGNDVSYLEIALHRNPQWENTPPYITSLSFRSPVDVQKLVERHPGIQFPNVVELHIPADDKAAALLFEMCPHAVEVDCSITKDTSQAFFQNLESRFPKMTSLCLAYHRDYTATGRLPGRIERLTLSGFTGDGRTNTTLSNETVQLATEGLVNLRNLRLRSTKCSDETFIHILRNNPHLRELDLISCSELTLIAIMSIGKFLPKIDRTYFELPGIPGYMMNPPADHPYRAAPTALAVSPNTTAGTTAASSVRRDSPADEKSQTTSGDPQSLD